MSAAAPREKKEEIVKEEKENKRKKKEKHKEYKKQRGNKTSHCHKECIPRSLKDNNSHRPREG